MESSQANAHIKFIRLEKGQLKSRGRNKADCERDLKIEQCKSKWLANELDLAYIIKEY